MRTIRDHVQHPVALDYFHERLSAGWRLRAIEWEQQDDTVSAPQPAVPEFGAEQPPYGLEIAPEAVYLRPNLQETAILLTILEMIVAEKNVSLIADELNLRGYRTRGGGQWNSATVFNLLPRIVDMGPALLRSSDWQSRRPHIQPAQ
jgi:Recombinase